MTILVQGASSSSCCHWGCWQVCCASGGRGALWASAPEPGLWHCSCHDQRRNIRKEVLHAVKKIGWAVAERPVCVPKVMLSVYSCCGVPNLGGPHLCSAVAVCLRAPHTTHLVKALSTGLTHIQITSVHLAVSIFQEIRCFASF